MSAPNLVGFREISWTEATFPRSTAAIAVTAGDIIVAAGIVENAVEPLTISTGAGSTCTTSAWSVQRTLAESGHCYVKLATATVTGDGNLVVQFTLGESYIFGGFATVWNATDGLGTVSPTNAFGNQSACSVSFDPTSTGTDSAIVMVVGDWETDAVSAVLTNMGAFTEIERAQESTAYSAYAGYHANCGTAGAANIGVNSSTMKWSLVAIEVKGTAGGGATNIPVTMTDALNA